MKIILIELFLVLLLQFSQAQKTNTIITIEANTIQCHLSDFMIGANMEDLHYQMTGGISSQLIHGESFFEPSLSQLAPEMEQIQGFSNCKGQWRAQNNELAVTVNNINTNNTSEVPAEVGIPQKGVGARLTSSQVVLKSNYSIGVDVWFPKNSQSTASLIFNVHPNNADNGW